MTNNSRLLETTFNSTKRFDTVPYFPRGDTVLAQQLKISREDILKFQNRDLHKLLSCSPKEFWSHLLFDKQLKVLIDSFFASAPKPYDTDVLFSTITATEAALGYSEHRLERLLSKRMFMIHSRMIAEVIEAERSEQVLPESMEEDTKENQEEAQIKVIAASSYENASSAPAPAAELTVSEVYAKVLQKCLHLPKVLDVTAMYYYSATSEVQKMLAKLFLVEPTYFEQLRESVPYFIGALDQIVRSLVIPATHTISPAEIQDMLTYVYDTTFNLSTLVKAAPIAAIALFSPSFHHMQQQESEKEEEEPVVGFSVESATALSSSLLNYLVLIYEAVCPKFEELVMEQQNEALLYQLSQLKLNILDIIYTILKEVFFDSVISFYQQQQQPNHHSEETNKTVKRDFYDKYFKPIFSKNTKQSFEQSLEQEQSIKLAKKVQDEWCSDILKETYHELEHDLLKLLNSIPSISINLLDEILVNYQQQQLLEESSKKKEKSKQRSPSSLIELDAKKIVRDSGLLMLDLCETGKLYSLLAAWNEAIPQNKKKFKNVMSSIQLLLEIIQQLKVQYGLAKPTLKLNIQSRAEEQVPSKHLEPLKELFPHLGDGFLQACLDHFHDNIEAASNHLFDESALPPSLSKLDRKLSLVSYFLEHKQKLQHIQIQPPTFAATEEVLQSPTSASDILSPYAFEDVDMFDIHIGKRDKTKGIELNKVDADLKRKIVEAFTYDDEYDDSYDVVTKVVEDESTAKEKHMEDMLAKQKQIAKLAGGHAQEKPQVLQRPRESNNDNRNAAQSAEKGEQYSQRGGERGGRGGGRGRGRGYSGGERGGRGGGRGGHRQHAEQSEERPSSRPASSQSSSQPPAQPAPTQEPPAQQQAPQQAQQQQPSAPSAAEKYHQKHGTNKGFDNYKQKTKQASHDRKYKAKKQMLNLHKE